MPPGSSAADERRHEPFRAGSSSRSTWAGAVATASNRADDAA